MSIQKIRALTFDTGGTILDWHTGVSSTLSQLGNKHGIDADWAAIAKRISGPVTKSYGQPWRRSTGN